MPARCSVNIEDKVRIAKALARVGVRRMEVFLCAVNVVGCRAGVAHHRPLTDDEFLSIVLERGAMPAEST